MFLLHNKHPGSRVLWNENGIPAEIKKLRSKITDFYLIPHFGYRKKQSSPLTPITGLFKSNYFLGGGGGGGWHPFTISAPKGPIAALKFALWYKTLNIKCGWILLATYLLINLQIVCPDDKFNGLLHNCSWGAGLRVLIILTSIPYGTNSKFLLRCIVKAL